jgi:uncharacterized protein (TIGR01777 family)
MRVIVTGSHGLIGSALIAALTAAGHQPVRVVRGSPEVGEIRWDPESGMLDGRDLAGMEAAVHLAGEALGAKRWNAQQKHRILDSRVRGTELLCRRLAEVDPRPGVLVAGSAIGFYGDRGSEELDEHSGPGTGFLADVAQQWERATSAAADAGIRVVRMRSGVVLSPAGGALQKQLPLFRAGLGGRLGSGRQYLSWVSLDDEVGAILFALAAGDLAGPVNVTSPNPVTNADFTRTLGAVLGRPAILAVPRIGLATLLGGEMADEMLLGGQRVLPKQLLEHGYRFAQPDLEPALRHLLGR